MEWTEWTTVAMISISSSDMPRLLSRQNLYALRVIISFKSAGQENAPKTWKNDSGGEE